LTKLDHLALKIMIKKEKY